MPETMLKGTVVAPYTACICMMVTEQSCNMQCCEFLCTSPEYI